MYRLPDWIAKDPLRCQVLACVAQLHLPDAWVAAGFVRNLVWDRLHGYTVPTPLTDIDVIYFDPVCRDPERDTELENRLRACAALPWSVKNQARMHKRNGDAPYHSSLDAMSYWVEMETALAARLLTSGQIEIASPFVQHGLFKLHVTPNLKRYKPEVFRQRQHEKAGRAGGRNFGFYLQHIYRPTCQTDCHTGKIVFRTRTTHETPLPTDYTHGRPVIMDIRLRDPGTL